MLGEYVGSGSTITKGLYRFNGNANDSSGNGNNGTGTDITYVNGKFGQGASFNGTSSRVQLASNSIMNGLTALTVNTRITFATFSNSSLRGILGSQSNYVGVLHFQYYSTNSSDFGIQFQVGGMNPSSTFIPASISLNERYMVTSTYNTTTKVGRIYLNGIDIGGQTYTTSPTINISTVLDIGRCFNTTREHSGLMDEVIIDNKVRTPAEIQRYYTYAKGRFVL